MLRKMKMIREIFLLAWIILSIPFHEDAKVIESEVIPFTPEMERACRICGPYYPYRLGPEREVLEVRIDGKWKRLRWKGEEMNLKPHEVEILNSWEIDKEFKQKAYKPPIITKKFCSFRGKSGKAKKYSEDEIFLYKVRKYAKEVIR
jgi:hypothetical protein